MDIAPALCAVLLLEVLVAITTLRTLSRISDLDELSQRQWDELARLHSRSGIAFFPTVYARVELERAIAEVVELERVPA